MVKMIALNTMVGFAMFAGVIYAQSPAQGSYATVNGLKMYYEVQGAGEPLVLIHGGGSTIGTSFGRIIPLFAERYKVVAMELQAHGHSGDRTGPVTFEQDADDVAALLRHLRISKASFLGFSNGGTTAMQIALRHPDIVTRLVIASALYKREGMVPGFFEGMTHATINDMPEALREAFLQANPDSAALLTMFTKDRDRMLRFVDWKDETLRSIHASTLIINGDRDVVLSRHAVAMSELIQGSRLMILPATHGSYLGASESGPPDTTVIRLTADIVGEFLSGH